MAVETDWMEHVVLLIVSYTPANAAFRLVGLLSTPTHPHKALVCDSSVLSTLLLPEDLALVIKSRSPESEEQGWDPRLPTPGPLPAPGLLTLHWKSVRDKPIANSQGHCVWIAQSPERLEWFDKLLIHVSNFPSRRWCNGSDSLQGRADGVSQLHLLADSTLSYLALIRDKLSRFSYTYWLLTIHAWSFFFFFFWQIG